MPARAGNEPGKRVVIGRISGVHGIRGWLKVFSYTDPRENIFLYQPWLLEDGSKEGGGKWTEIECADSGTSGKTLVARLPGIEDREAALQFVGRSLAVSRERLPEPEPGQYYWTDLMRMEVVTLAGERLGKVVDIHATGANDVLVVQGDGRQAVPFVMEEVIRRVDRDAAVITVDWEWD